MIQNITLFLLSVYTPQKGLSDMKKVNFFDSLWSISSNIGIDCIFFYHRDFAYHAGQVAAGYEGMHSSFPFGLGIDT